MKFKYLSAVESNEAVDNEELARIFNMDQADRDPGPDGIDWDAVDERDAERPRAQSRSWSNLS